MIGNVYFGSAHAGRSATLYKTKEGVPCQRSGSSLFARSKPVQSRSHYRLIGVTKPPRSLRMKFERWRIRSGKRQAARLATAQSSGWPRKRKSFDAASHAERRLHGHDDQSSEMAGLQFGHAAASEAIAGAAEHRFFAAQLASWALSCFAREGAAKAGLRGGISNAVACCLAIRPPGNFGEIGHERRCGKSLWCHCPGIQ